MIADWKFHDFAPGAGRSAQAHASSFDDSMWLPIAVPGDVHTALVAAGRIADPFYDRNEHDCAWMEAREWWYRGTMHAPDAMQEGERLRLVFHGLDTFVTIWLNGEVLGRHQNMFRPAVFDVTTLVRVGQPNSLALCFDRPLDQLGDIDVSHWWEASAPRVAMRKAQFGYGWDWGPRLPTIGIWRPVELQRERRAILAGVHATTLEIDATGQWAALAVRVEAERFATTAPLTAHIRLCAPHDATAVVEQTVSLLGRGARAQTTAYLSVEQPRLWWTHDLGDPARYTLSVTLALAGTTLDQQEQQIGIRTITLDQSPDPDEPGTRFFRFVLNGVPLFARGANWIPADSFVGALPPERYARLLRQARDANMTMLRVWGGGIYEHDTFYDQCDELGMLVWQDFMFACAPYPDDHPPFVAEVEAEARYQVRRLRNHPCLAVWCGNNENQWLHEVTFWREPGARLPGARLYDTVLPTVVAAEDGRTPYWPGSPYGGNDHNSMDDGDRHHWEAWHGNRPLHRRFGDEPYRDTSPAGVSYHNYASDMGRFISEFGLHAAPVRATLARVIPAEQRFHHSPSMDQHNKDTPKNKGDHLLATVTGMPRDLDDYIDFSMIAQAEGLKFAIEHYRRRMPHCSGTLIWQLNDCWPALSWSVLDYYGVGKAGYYYTKRAYTPVLASFKELANGTIELWLTNATSAAVQDVVCVGLYSFTGDARRMEEFAVAVAAHTSRCVSTHAAPDATARADCYLGVHAQRDTFLENRHFFTAIQDLRRPPATLEVTTQVRTPHEFEVTLHAATFAYFVHLVGGHPAIDFSDNYFDLAAHDTRTIRVSCAEQPIAPDEVHIHCR